MSKKDIKLFGYTISFGFSIILLVTIIHAFLRGNYRYAIDINHFGEAWIELILFVILFIMSSIGFYIELKEYKTVNIEQ